MDTLQAELIQTLASLEACLPNSAIYFSRKRGMKILPKTQEPESDLIFIGLAKNLMFLYDAKKHSSSNVPAKEYAYELAARHVSNVLDLINYN